jgi:Na+-driven multidrug efflux pump
MLLLWCKGPIIKPATEFFTQYCFRSFPGTLYDGKQYYKGGGQAKFAMVAMIIPYCQHYIRYYFIKVMGLGMFGAALATSISYFMCFLFCSVVFVYKRIKTESKTFLLHLPIIKEITALSFVTFQDKA